MIDPLVIPIVAIVGFFVSMTVGAIAHYIFSIQRLRIEIALKQDLVLRGFSAREIAEIVAVQSGSMLEPSHAHPQKPLKHVA
jgi:hypothetical protein